MRSISKVHLEDILPLSRKRSGYKAVIASDSRIGRIRRAVKRAFIVSNGELITMRDVLARAYPRLRRFNDWHRWSCRRALLVEGATVIARMRFTRGRPNIWALREHSGANRGANATENH